MSTVPFASAANPTEQRAQLAELGRDVWGYLAPSDPNCGFIITDNSVVAGNGRAAPALAREVIADIATVSDHPVRWMVLTHYHAVRTLAASAFGIETIIASRGTHELIQERGAEDRESELRRFPRLFRGSDEISGLTQRRIAFEGRMTLHLGGREIALAQLDRSHTRGDALIHVPNAGVTFAGDMVENRCAIYADDACLDDWLGALERLRAWGTGGDGAGGEAEP
jgi:glyoxylase-like metal-dependent hydrolase (beta-lactamase superfamily II)